jgi:hypothetical protein
MIDHNICKVGLPEAANGEWSIEKFTVPKLADASLVERIAMLRHELTGRPVTPGDYTRLLHGDEIIMSDTPAEIEDHRAFLNVLEITGGRVLVNGLGLGMAIKAALEVGVSHVDVVEIDPTLIALVAPCYDDPRVTIHEGDALTFKWAENTTWDVVWHDIWPTICDDNLPEMKRLHRMYGHRCKWQGSWGRDFLEG